MIPAKHLDQNRERARLQNPACPRKENRGLAKSSKVCAVGRQDRYGRKHQVTTAAKSVPSTMDRIKVRKDAFASPNLMVSALWKMWNRVFSASDIIKTRATGAVPQRAARLY